MLQGLDDAAAAEASLTAPTVRASDWGFAKVPSIDSLFAAVENGHESPFLATLQSSRTFHSPDCSEAMAEILQVSRALEGLQVTAAPLLIRLKYVPYIVLHLSLRVHSLHHRSECGRVFLCPIPGS